MKDWNEEIKSAVLTSPRQGFVSVINVRPQLLLLCGKISNLHLVIRKDFLSIETKYFTFQLTSSVFQNYISAKASSRKGNKKVYIFYQVKCHLKILLKSINNVGILSRHFPSQASSFSIFYNAQNHNLNKPDTTIKYR